jgi:hypothetical protein
MFRVSLSRLIKDKVVVEKELQYLDDGDLINITRNTKGLPQKTMKNIDTRRLYKKTAFSDSFLTIRTNTLNIKLEIIRNQKSLLYPSMHPTGNFISFALRNYPFINITS